MISLAGDKTVDLTDPCTNYVPQALASSNPLIRVGSGDKTGNITPQSRKGDVYMVGQDFVYAEPSFLPAMLSTQNKYIDRGYVTSGGEYALI